MAGRPVHTFEVVRSEQLTPHLIRVVLGGNGFDTFTPNEFTDAYVKIVFVNDGVDVGALPQPLTLDSFNDLTRRTTAHRPHLHRAPRRHRAPRDLHRLRRARRARRRRAVGGRGHPGSTGLPDGAQRRLRARPRGRLAPVRRRRGGRSGHRRRAGGLARQRNWQGLHRGRRTRGRDRAAAHRPASR